jgi:hypothetical protein
MEAVVDDVLRVGAYDDAPVVRGVERRVAALHRFERFDSGLEFHLVAGCAAVTNHL